MHSTDSTSIDLMTGAMSACLRWQPAPICCFCDYGPPRTWTKESESLDELSVRQESPDTDLSAPDTTRTRGALGKLGTRNRVLAVPPDQSREHSGPGELTRYAWQYYGDRLKAVLPALGTHTAMRPDQIAHMFGDVPQNLFHVSLTGATDVRPSAKSPPNSFETIRRQIGLCVPGSGQSSRLKGCFD